MNPPPRARLHKWCECEYGSVCYGCGCDAGSVWRSDCVYARMRCDRSTRCANRNNKRGAVSQPTKPTYTHTCRPNRPTACTHAREHAPVHISLRSRRIDRPRASVDTGRRRRRRRRCRRILSAFQRVSLPAQCECEYVPACVCITRTSVAYLEGGLWG